MKDYDKTVRGSQAFYRLTYSASNLTATSTILENIFSFLLTKLMQGILDEFRPDIVLSTYHIFNAPVGRARRNHPAIPFFTVVTDLANIHKFWFHPSPDKYFIANEVVQAEGLKNHVPGEKMILTGIPVHPDFAREKRTSEEIRKELGWQPGLTTLLAVSSRRVGHMFEHLQAINQAGFPVQLIIVTGGDNHLYDQLKANPWQIPVQFYNYVDNIPAMMKAADILISKAGGLILAEGLACGLPILMMDYIPEQESGNISFVRDHQAGFLAETPHQLVKILDDWLQDKSRLEKVSFNSRQIGRPYAAYQIAEVVWQAVCA